MGVDEREQADPEHRRQSPRTECLMNWWSSADMPGLFLVSLLRAGSKHRDHPAGAAAG